MLDILCKIRKSDIIKRGVYNFFFKFKIQAKIFSKFCNLKSVICSETQLLYQVNHVLIPETQRYIEGLMNLKDTNSDLYRDLLEKTVIPKVKLNERPHCRKGLVSPF